MKVSEMICRLFGHRLDGTIPYRNSKSVRLYACSRCGYVPAHHLTPPIRAKKGEGE